MVKWPLASSCDWCLLVRDGQSDLKIFVTALVCFPEEFVCGNYNMVA